MPPTRRGILQLGCAGLLAAVGGQALAADPAPVDEAGYVSIGGIDQWIEIHGQDRRNPAILVLHGGPGSTWDPLRGLFAEWEKHFTIAYWSQRGAGKTFRARGPSIASTMTIERMAADGIEAADYVRNRLGQDKVILLGHSWGTVLGILIAQQRPDLVEAYVGTGQMVNTVEGERAGYRETLRRARLAGRADAVVSLEALGEPPFDDIQKMVTERRWAGEFDTPSDAAFNAAWKNPPQFTAADNAERNRAWLFSNLIMFGQKRQDGPVMQVDFTRTALSFRVPMVFIQGADDHITPTPLVVDYVGRLHAPRKTLVQIPGGGHNVVTTMPSVFLADMMRALGPA